MYHTYMSTAATRDLRRIDSSLRRMRRAFEPPGAVTDARRRVEASTLLVLEALLGGGARTVRDVARDLGVAHSTASRLVTRAQDAGMVRRAASPDSGREVCVEATPDGVATRERGLSFRAAQLRRATADWDAADVEAFAGLLERFATGISTATPPGRGT